MIKYYVRVSTVEQKLDRQLLAYDKADIIYSDKVSGKDKERPQLKLLLEGLVPGDIVVVKSFVYGNIKRVLSRVSWLEPTY